MKLLIVLALVFVMQQDTVLVKKRDTIKIPIHGQMNRSLNKVWDMNAKLDSILLLLEKKDSIKPDTINIRNYE